MAEPDFQVAITIPVAEALISAVQREDRDKITRLLDDVAYPKTLAVILAGAIEPLLLMDANFHDVQYDHPALSYHAGRYENGDRDLLATHSYVHRQSIPDSALAIGPMPATRRAHA